MLLTKQASHTVLGFIPELEQILLIDNSTGRRELWIRDRGVVVSHTIILDGHELEFVREVKSAYRVPDTEYNRTNHPHEIGRIYVDEKPLGVEVRMLV